MSEGAKRNRSGDNKENWYKVREGIECETYTVPEIARIFGIGLKLAYSLIESGEIPSIRLGSHVKVSRHVVDQMLRRSDHVVQ